MATNFPTSLDALTNPTSGSALNSPDHAGQHADANDAIEALQAKVGVDGSAVTTSLDYKVTNGIHSSLNVDSGTLVVDATNNRVGVNVSSPAHALDVVGRVETRAAATQDGVAIVGRAGGTGSFDITLTPTTLTADRTLTLPNETGTVVSTATVDPAGATSNQILTYNGTKFVPSAPAAAAAGTLTGTTLASNVVSSSLTSVGTLGSLAVTGDLIVDTNTLRVDSTNNRVGVNVTSPAVPLDVVGRVEVRAAATQDGVALAGRAGGTSSYEATLTPTTLTADRTLTLPDISGTVITTGNLSSITSTGITWTSWTPTWTASVTNPTLNNGVLSGRYMQVGKGVFCQIFLQIGSTTNIGSGEYRWALPFTAASPINSFLTIGDGRTYDASAVTARLANVIFNGGATTYVSLYVASAICGSVNPVIPATSDEYHLSFFYEAA